MVSEIGPILGETVEYREPTMGEQVAEWRKAVVLAEAWIEALAQAGSTRGEIDRVIDGQTYTVTPDRHGLKVWRAYLARMKAKIKANT